MKQIILFAISFSVFLFSQGQTNILVTNPEADNILKGSYDPADYTPTAAISDHQEIICGINERTATDSLLQYLKKLASFYNRNTGSDTLSNDTGIGATRRWVYKMFESFSSDNENRLIPSYLQFDQSICGASQHRNIFAVLPGIDTTDKSIIIVEAHIDSRCETGCDIDCNAPGVDDNGSGSALVIELARVMSRYAFKNTIVFLLNMSEEQGLNGARAFAKYCFDNGIEVKSVFNNDVVGGIYCGNTASPPSKCTIPGMVDSTHTRVFSNGAYTKQNRGLARLTSLVYREKLLPIVKVPMTIQIMNQQDRDGRGGDHIPFSDMGFPAVRFTAAHEHGNGSPDSNYTDRQHTSNDILGIDTNSDGKIDSFFIDMHYLKRNIVLNGSVMTVVAQGPKTPEFDINNTGSELTIQINDPVLYPKYRVGVRTSVSVSDFDADFEAMYSFTGSRTFTIPGLLNTTNYFISAASVDEFGMTSIFSSEKFKKPLNNSTPGEEDSVNLFINCYPVGLPGRNINRDDFEIIFLSLRPNPFNNEIELTVKYSRDYVLNEASVFVSDISGKIIDRLKVQLDKNKQYVVYPYKINNPGVYYFSLNTNGRITSTKKAIFVK